EAIEELEQARKQAEEHLSREQLTRVADVLKRLGDRQERLKADAERIQRQGQQRKGGSLVLKKRLLSTGRVPQQGLVAETAEVADKQLAGSPVFARNVKRAAEAMDRAAERLSEIASTGPAPETLPDAQEDRLQGEA